MSGSTGTALMPPVQFIDTEAERFALGCLLQGSDDERLHSALFGSELRRRLFDAALAVDAEGLLVNPENGSPRAAHVAAQQNLARVAIAAGGDEAAAKIELRECLTVVTLPEFLPEHIQRLDRSESERRLSETIEAARRQMEDSTADRSEIVAELMAGLQGAEHKSGTFRTLSSSELDSGEFELSYHVDGLLVAGQPCVIAGPKKCLKTNLMIDLAISLATGGWFLQKFKANRPFTVGLMSGESGEATIQETARRICCEKDIPLGEVTGLRWSFELPTFGQPADERKLQRFVEDNGLDVLMIDPAYLCLPIGDDAGNLFKVGQFLKTFTRIGVASGCTLMIAHHMRKRAKGKDQHEPPELEDIAWSGFQEWARQWLLVSRREPYDASTAGSHKLWLSAGGSAGHSGLWGLDIEEGHSGNRGGRHWTVEVLRGAEVIAESKSEQERGRQEQEERKLQSDIQRVRSVLDKLPADGESKSVIAALARLSGGRATAPISILCEDGILEPCEIEKSNGRKYDGFRVTQTSRTDSDSVGQSDPEHTVGQPPYRGGPSVCARAGVNGELSESECDHEHE